MRDAFAVKSFTWDDDNDCVALNGVEEVGFTYGEVYNLSITLNELDDDINLFDCIIYDNRGLITDTKDLLIYNYKLLNELQSFNRFEGINECRKALKYIFSNRDKVVSRCVYNNIDPYNLIDELMRLLTYGNYIICRYNR